MTLLSLADKGALMCYIGYSVFQVGISDIVLVDFSLGACLDVCVEWVNVHY